jgi:hypothetical protein
VKFASSQLAKSWSWAAQLELVVLAPSEHIRVDAPQGDQRRWDPVVLDRPTGALGGAVATPENVPTGAM